MITEKLCLEFRRMEDQLRRMCTMPIQICVIPMWIPPVDTLHVRRVEERWNRGHLRTF